MSARGLWLTRPLRDSQRMVEPLRAAGFMPMVAPVMEIHRCAIHIPANLEPAGLLLTSRHACYALPSLPIAWRRLPVYCVGRATAATARRHGFTRTVTGSGSAMALLRPILDKQRKGDVLLHLSGEEVRIDFTPILARYDISIRRSMVYTSIAATALSDEIASALRDSQLHGVTLYSPRSATIAHGLLSNAGCLSAMREVTAYCLSLEVAAAAAAELDCKHIHACAVPTHQAMMELLSSHAIARHF